MSQFFSPVYTAATESERRAFEGWLQRSQQRQAELKQQAADSDAELERHDRALVRGRLQPRQPYGTPLPPMAAND